MKEPTNVTPEDARAANRAVESGKIISMPGTETYEIQSYRAADLKPKKQPWLWDGYIPFETSTLIAGKGGIGKSQLLMWIASRVSNGDEFTINNVKYSLPQGNVIILSAEDDKEYTIIPRLISLNANRNNIHILTSAINPDMPINERFISLDKDIALLERKIIEIGNVKLIIIDPINAYIGEVRENRQYEVRTFVLKLNKLASTYKLCNLLNTHPRKSSNGEGPSNAVDEISGSNAWSNTVRTTFSIVKHPDDDDLYVFAVSKTNFKKPDTLAYRIKSTEIDSEEGVIPISMIEWHLGKIDLSADEVINKKSYEDKLATDIAKEFILDTLKFGSKPAQEITKLALDNDINPNTLKLARQRLNKEGISVVMEASQTDRRKMIWYLGNSPK